MEVPGAFWERVKVGGLVKCRMSGGRFSCCGFLSVFVDCTTLPEAGKVEMSDLLCLCVVQTAFAVDI